MHISGLVVEMFMHRGCTEEAEGSSHVPVAIGEHRPALLEGISKEKLHRGAPNNSPQEPLSLCQVA